MKFERTGAPSPGASATSRASSPQSTSAVRACAPKRTGPGWASETSATGPGTHAPGQHGRDEHLRADRQRARVARHLGDHQRGLERAGLGRAERDLGEARLGERRVERLVPVRLRVELDRARGARVLRAQRVDRGEDRALIVVPLEIHARYSRGRSSQRLAIRFRLISVVPTATPAVIASRQYDSAKFPYASASAP